MHRTARTMQTVALLTLTMGPFLLGCQKSAPETSVVPPADPSSDHAKPSLQPESATQPAGKSEADQHAIWEARVGKPITLEGFAFRAKDGVKLRPTGTGARCLYGIKLHNVLRELRGGGKGLPSASPGRYNYASTSGRRLTSSSIIVT